LLGQGPLCAAYGFDPLHAFLHRRFCEIGALLEFLQDARALVLLLEALDRAIDRFVFSNDDAYQTSSPPFGVNRLLLCFNILDDVLKKAALAEPFERYDNGAGSARCLLF